MAVIEKVVGQDTILELVVVTGGREWSDRAVMERVFAELQAEHDPEGEHTWVVVQGGARGADIMAAQVGRSMGWMVQEFPALWALHGKAAGFIRNQRMVDFATALAVLPSVRVHVRAFKADFDSQLRSGGTEDMVRRCKAAGLGGKIVRG